MALCFYTGPYKKMSRLTIEEKIAIICILLLIAAIFKGFYNVDFG